MALLKDIAEGKVAGLAPIDVGAYAISTYFVNDGLFNLMHFAPFSTNANFAASYTRYNEQDGVDATFRGLGEEYDASDAEPEQLTVYLKRLGGSYHVDRTTERALRNKGINVWKEQQLAQKANQIKNAFAKYFISGDTDENSKGFDGVYKAIFSEYTEQEDTATFDLSAGINFNNAFAFEAHLRKTIAKMNARPNLIITTRDGSALLGTLNSIRNLGAGSIEIRDVKYDQCMGIPIVTVNDDYFPADKLALGTPFLFLYIADDDKGIKCGLPQDDVVLDIVDPEIGSGTLVKQGAMEMITAPIFQNPKAAAVCYVLTNPTAVAGVQFVTENFELGVGQTRQLVWAIKPVNATNKNVAFTSSDPTKATVLPNGTVTAVAEGTATITITTADGGKTDTVVATVTAAAQG